MNQLKLALYVSLLLGASNALADSWNDKGYSDGVHGLEMKNVAAVDGVSQQETAAYQTAYFEGLNKYCQTETAKNLVKAGTGYDGVCKYSNQSWAFQNAYNTAVGDSLEQRNIEKWEKLSKTRWFQQYIKLTQHNGCD